MPDRRVVVCCVGLKGATFLEGLEERGLFPTMVAAYPQADDHSDSFERIHAVASRIGCTFVETRKPDLQSFDLTFLVGWQYLIAGTGPNTVVFHDSLLPRYRGFAPTVAALLNGDGEIGVTAIRPIEEVDEGPIIDQASVPVAYPLPIAQALEMQATIMVELAERIHRTWLDGDLSARAQDHTKATYSLWRDELDYLIDWSQPAPAIARFVDAVGYPYAGAEAWVGNEHVKVVRARALPDLRFEHRQCGKIWRIEDGRPQVVCGSGLLVLEDCRTMDGAPFIFRKLRARLGGPP